MGRRRKNRDKVDGILLINKEVGLTSNGVLQRVMRLMNAQKGGHTGALDPFATGLLPICLGEATKVSGLLLDADKTYQATLKLGQATTTGDTEGKVIMEQPVPQMEEESVQTVLQGFCGAQTQVPPMFSALKFEGKPLYEYARQGIEIERPARPIHIYRLELLSLNEDEIQFEVRCSKGTYVRTLGEDIAKALNTVGHLTTLHRSEAGGLTGETMLTLAELEQAVSEGEVSLLPIDTALQNYDDLVLTEEEVKLIRQGGMLAKPRPSTDFIRLYDEHGQIVALGEWHEKTQQIKAKRVFLI